MDAAKAQTVKLPAADLVAELVAELAQEVSRLDGLLADLDAKIDTRFRQHSLAHIVISLLGMGPRLGAEFGVSPVDESTRF